MFPENLTRLRKKSKWTKADLAQRLQVTTQTVAHWEGGKALPDEAMLFSISEVLGVSVQALLGEETLKEFDESDVAFQLNRLRLILEERNQANKRIRRLGLLFVGVGLLFFILQLVWGMIYFR